MRWIGLTGGIASGKTSVSNILRNEGVAVADADQIAFEIVAHGTPGLESVIKTFGEEFRLRTGGLDRAKLGKKIFDDEAARLLLESLLHPLIQQTVAKQRAEWQDQGRTFAVYDVPLLFEKKMEAQFDEILLVVADEDQQRQRLIKRNQLSVDDAHSRLKAQIPISEKIHRAHQIIQNDGTLDHLRSQVMAWLARERRPQR